MSLDGWFTGRRLPMLALAGGGRVPRRFTDPLAEHRATRDRAGLFDFSFMGAWDFRGPAACAALMRMQTRNLRGLRVGRIAYTLMLDDQGAVVIDATVWRLADDVYRLFTGRPSDAGRIAQLSRDWGAVPADRCGRDAIVALQGPRSAAVLARLMNKGVMEHLDYFSFAPAPVAGHSALVGRLGYSGELGYEIVVERDRGVALWQALVDAGRDCGVAECGFDAADTLRIESGYVLFSRELAPAATPQALGLQRLVELAHGPFLGREALRRARFTSPARRLEGLMFTPRSASPYAVRRRATATSACVSPTFSIPIGLGWVDSGTAPGDAVYTDDGRRAMVCRLPFYDPPRRRPRSRPALRLS